MRNINRLFATVLFALAMPTAGAATFAYIPFNGDAGWITVVDLERNAAVVDIHVGKNPDTVAVSPDGSLVYAANRVSNSVTVISTNNNQVVDTVPHAGISNPFASPSGLAAHPTLSEVYVSHQAGVTVFNSTDNSIITTIAARYSGKGIVFTPDGKYAVVVGNDGVNDGVTIIDTSTHGVVTDAALAYSGAGGIAVSADGQKVYIANYSSDNISVVSLQNYADATALTLSQNAVALGAGSKPYDVTLDAQYLYVSNEGDGTVAAFDLTAGTPTLVSTLALAPAPSYDSRYGCNSSQYATHPVHALGIATNSDGSIYVVKNAWCSYDNGTYLSKIGWNSSNQLVEERTLYSQSSMIYSQVYGQFLGPECVNCPRSFQRLDSKPYERPAAMGWLEIMALGALAGLRRRKRKHLA